MGLESTVCYFFTDTVQHQKVPINMLSIYPVYFVLLYERHVLLLVPHSE